MKVNMTIQIPVWVDRIFSWPVLVYRKLKYGCVFRKIPIGDGKFTVVDPEDYYRFAQYQWFAGGRGDAYYATRIVRTKTGQTRFVHSIMPCITWPFSPFP